MCLLKLSIRLNFFTNITFKGPFFCVGFLYVYLNYYCLQKFPSGLTFKGLFSCVGSYMFYLKKVLLCAKAFPQPGAAHLKGLSPVWILMCLAKSLFCIKSFPQ